MLSERIVDYLIAGDISFIERLNCDQRAFLVKGIRESQYKGQILFNSIKEIRRQYPELAFYITFDIPEYKDYWYGYFSNECELLRDRKFLLFFMLAGDWAVKIVLSKLDKIVNNNPDVMPAFFRYFERTKDFNLVQRLAYHSDLEIRAWFMLELLDCYSYLINVFYEDGLVNYFEYEGNLIEEEYVSKLAALCLLRVKNEELYEELKEFILSRYDVNTLAAELDLYGKLNSEIHPLNERAIIKDIDELFRTSKNYKYELVKRYPRHVDGELLSQFRKKILPFTWIDKDAMTKLFLSGLGDKFLDYVDKYLELSTGSKVIRDAGFGTCSRVFRVGDYALKVSHKKWSMEDVLCPNGYLFAKNYEEAIVRKSNGEVTGAIEVQKFLTRPLLAEDYEAIMHYHEALKREGYYTKDVLADKAGGANCYYLDSYLDADCDKPEELPYWFKETPVVLVDRDLVFKLENKNPKLKAINLK